MTATPISKADIERLAEALDGLDLPAEQKALLSAIVSLAAEVVAVDVAHSVPSFREQFAAAFTPGQANFLVVRLSGNIGRNIGR